MGRESAEGSRIRRVRELGPPSRGAFLLVWAGSSDEPTSVSLLVGRRIGKAHDRNRVRRRLREIVRRLPLDRPLVVSARTSARTASYWELSDELARLLPAAMARSRGDRTDPRVPDGDLAAPRTDLPI